MPAGREALALLDNCCGHHLEHVDPLLSLSDRAAERRLEARRLLLDRELCLPRLSLHLQLAVLILKLRVPVDRPLLSKPQRRQWSRLLVSVHSHGAGRPQPAPATVLGAY